MWIVVVKYTSMSQSVDRMELHTLTLVWLAVLIVVTWALGWVYFTSSCTVVRFHMQTQGFSLPFQETSNNLQNTFCQTPRGKKIMQYYINFFSRDDWSICVWWSDSTSALPCLHSVPTQWNFIRLSASFLLCCPDRALVMDLKVKTTTFGADRRE